MKKLVLVGLFLLSINYSFSQNILKDKIYTSTIKTVLMYSGDDDLSLPVWDLNSSKTLKLSFDVLTTDSKDYYYTIIHCNADWTPSDLGPSEYIEGYFEDRISDYQSSFNTNVNYLHYKLEIPNEYMKPSISGNYILKVYNGMEPDEVYFTKRFMVAERKTDIKVHFRNMNQTSYFNKDQELEVIVNYFESEIYDLDQNIQLQVLKNRDWNSTITMDRPDYIRDNEYTYNNYTKLKFPGGNEFHHFNTKNIHHYSENIVNISFVDNRYHFQIAENKDRTFDDYLYKPDINGQFRIDVNPGQFPETEADYVYVYFTLRVKAPMQQADIYVWGGLSNYNFTEENKMRYNYEQMVYEGRLFLKQGYYNYQYVLVENGKPDYTYIEGNHAVTENQYLVLVYYHDFRLGTDRLIGLTELSTKPQ
jgi:hypothetical protein